MIGKFFHFLCGKMYIAGAGAEAGAGAGAKIKKKV